jgi:hypothetical protein
VELFGWPHFRGGLDVKSWFLIFILKNVISIDVWFAVAASTTGTHSFHARLKHYEIMFHVSTMIPFTPHDVQQVERKRHLGNDVVVIVFKEGNTPFNPCLIRSHFNRKWLFVQR